MNPNSEFDRLIQFLPYEIRADVEIDLGTDEQERVIQPKFRFPWQDRTCFAIDPLRWRRLNADQQRIYFLREAALATEVALGNNWAALIVYPALLGIGATGFLVEMQLSDALGIGLASGLAGLAFLMLRRSEKGQKAQIAADEYAIRYAGQNGYSEQQAAGILLSAWKQLMLVEGSPKENYDTVIRQRNLEYLANRGLSSTGIAPIGSKPDASRNRPEPPRREPFNPEQRQRDFERRRDDFPPRY